MNVRKLCTNQINHGALCNLLCTMQQEPGCTGKDRLLAVTTISFDIVALELFLSLLRLPAVCTRGGLCAGARMGEWGYGSSLNLRRCFSTLHNHNS